MKTMLFVVLLLAPAYCWKGDTLRRRRPSLGDRQSPSP
jgi:hypothetical protein